ncbi:hypothetical protein P0214_23870, partial [Escherichia coli]
SLKTSIKTITYLSDIGCLEIQGASLIGGVVLSVGVCGFVRFAVVLLWGVLVVLVIVLLRVWSNGRWAIPFVVVFELFVWSV